MRNEWLVPLQKNLEDTLQFAIRCDADGPCLIIHDERSLLAGVLTEGYRKARPQGQFLSIEKASFEEIMAAIDALPPDSLVVLVQSSNFRLNEFRFRIELFKRRLRVIEHVHLDRMSEKEMPLYIESLAYDPAYYAHIGPLLKAKVDACKRITLAGKDWELVYDSPFEDSKLNIGDYRHLKNVGGQFPIGEVFSEPKDLTRVSGEVEFFAYGDTDFTVHAPEKPIRARIEGGQIVDAWNAPDNFQYILTDIKNIEKAVWIRELGFGLNRAFDKHRRVSDIGAYERMSGIHVSIGAKHAMFTKDGFPKKQCKFHVDAFADVEKVLIDDDVVFEAGKYLL